MNIVVKRAFGFGVAHLLVTITCLIVSFSLGMERFEVGNVNEGIVESVTGNLTNILMTPGKYIWNTWASKNLPKSFQWGMALG